MAVHRFPDPRTADESGLLAFGGDLQPETLILAYRQGIFPWPIEGLPLPWFCPAERGVLLFRDLHIPRSLERARKRSKFTFTIDRAFREVIEACAKIPRPAPEGAPQDAPAGTWITDYLRDAYIRLYERGLAHSVEVWEGEALVGGIYGVSVEGTFAGESMFHRRDDASKLALLHLVDHLSRRGLDWMDIQMVTPHLERMGGKLIPRDAFLEKLTATQMQKLRLFDTATRE